MHLPDRGGRDRLPVEGPKQLLDRAAQLALEDLPHRGRRKRPHLVEQLEELEAVVRRQEVEAQRQRLAELDPGAAEIFENRLHRSARWAAAAGKPGQEQMSPAHAQDLPTAPHHTPVRAVGFGVGQCCLRRDISRRG